jgi:hypothetical protein
VLDAGSFAAVADLAGLASAQGGGSPQSPFVARLGSGIDIANDWGAVNTAVQSVQKYVLLDLRNCAVSGGGIRGTNVTPAGNQFNIIRDNPYIKHIMLPETLVSIGNYTFYQCTGLTGLTIPETATDIRLSAFEECTSLVSVDIPDSVITLGSAVFRNCARLERVSRLPDMAALSADLFMNCVSLTGVTIPEGTSIIGSRAFYGCESLTHITLPDSVTSIAPNAFYGTGITSVAIPDSVTKIENFAFSQCAGLTSIRIPGTVSSLGTAFQGCARLEEVTFGARSAPLTVPTKTFTDCRSLGRVVFEDANIIPTGISANLNTAYTAGGPGTYELAGTQWYKRG